MVRAGHDGLFMESFYIFSVSGVVCIDSLSWVRGRVGGYSPMWTLKFQLCINARQVGFRRSLPVGHMVTVQFPQIQPSKLIPKGLALLLALAIRVHGQLKCDLPVEFWQSAVGNAHSWHLHDINKVWAVESTNRAVCTLIVGFRIQLSCAPSS